MASVANDSFLAAARSVVGDRHVRTDDGDVAPYTKDWRGRYSGRARCVLFPRSTAEVAALIRLCGEHRVPIVPQAGNTGLTGGAVPLGPAEAAILNVSRLNTVREIDAANASMTVEAGCILADVREKAATHDLLFPMLLGSVGSCEIGGLVSTNAGGTGVLRYGNMRELVLGLEVVLPDGRIWEGLRALRKDNAGYDLKQLFIGAEGTLGIVTAAVLKLFPRPVQSASAMASLESVADAVQLLGRMKRLLGSRIEAFEIMSRSQLEVVLRHGHGLRSPMAVEAPWYVLIEVADSSPAWNAEAQLEIALADAAERELIIDAVIAADIAKAERIWALRHTISEANKLAGFTVSNDTSVPISKLPAFIDRVEARLVGMPGLTLCHVGHMGDGNIHVVGLLARDIHPTPEACEEAAAIVNGVVHEESVALNGSISAEHGVGMMHRDRLVRFKPPLDLEMMRAVRVAFDPQGLMNPGKVLNDRRHLT